MSSVYLVWLLVKCGREHIISSMQCILLKRYIGFFSDEVGKQLTSVKVQFRLLSQELIDTVSL